jgi:hypothetical protein
LNDDDKALPAFALCAFDFNQMVLPKSLSLNENNNNSTVDKVKCGEKQKQNKELPKHLFESFSSINNNNNNNN